MPDGMDGSPSPFIPPGQGADTGSMTRRPAWILWTSAIALMLTLVLTWGVGEMHYRNCVHSVEIGYGQAPTNPLDDVLRESGRDKALADCSRLPF